MRRARGKDAALGCGGPREGYFIGMLRWYDSKINNSILEGLNSLVQATKARGTRTFKNLKTIITMITGKLGYAKVGLPT